MKNTNTKKAAVVANAPAETKKAAPVRTATKKQVVISPKAKETGKPAQKGIEMVPIFKTGISVTGLKTFWAMLVF